MHIYYIRIVEILLVLFIIYCFVYFYTLALFVGITSSAFYNIDCIEFYNFCKLQFTIHHFADYSLHF